MTKEELAATINGREVESMIVLTEKYRELVEFKQKTLRDETRTIVMWPDSGKMVYLSNDEVVQLAHEDNGIKSKEALRVIQESYDIIAHVKKMSILQFLRWRREPIAERTSSFINAFGVKTMLVK